MTPLDLYTYPTPNGHKVSIMLEEVGLPYRVHLVDIERDEQNRPEFLALNPNNKIPVIVDTDRARTVVESGAILFYLAERARKLVPDGADERDATLRWVLFQAAHIGPTLGQIWNWKIFADEKPPQVIARFEREAARLFRVLDAHLAHGPYLVGASFGIADVMTWPWVRIAEPTLRLDLAPYPHVRRWLGVVAARPAVARGLEVPVLPRSATHAA